MRVSAYRSRQREGWPAGKGEVPQPHTISNAKLKIQGNGSEAGKAEQTLIDLDN